MEADRSPQRGHFGLLFVYGTLMRGEPAAHLLETAQFLGEDRTRERFTMVSLGDYPAICEGSTSIIQGELYRVPRSIIAALDTYEECPAVYRRLSVALLSGGWADAYVLPVEQLPSTCQVIASGRWRDLR